MITSALIPTRSWQRCNGPAAAAAWSTPARSSTASALSTGDPASGLVAHETAHQWFGDSVTEKDWDDVWLSEGFATYFALLTAEHYEGRDAFVAGLKRSRATVFNAEKRMPGVAVVQDKPWKGIPNAVVYQKGGWTLHILRGEIGTEKFWAGIREYYRRYRDSNASTAGLSQGDGRGRRERTWAGSSSNGPIAPARPSSKEVGSTTRRPKGSKSNWSRSRTASRSACRSRSAVQGKIEKVVMTRKQQRFELAADKEPSSVELDPNTWILMDAHFEKR